MAAAVWRGRADSVSATPMAAAVARRLAAPPSRRPAPTRRVAARAAAEDAPSFTVLSIPGDGSCLFRALAQGAAVLDSGKPLPRSELRAAGFAVRRGICAHIATHAPDFTPFIDAPLRAYLAGMMLEGTWGGEVELAAAPAVVRRPVCVYQREPRSKAGSGLGLAAAIEALAGGGGVKKISEYGVGDHPGTAPVCLLFGNMHYETLVLRE
jgi:hypothetical protein